MQPDYCVFDKTNECLVGLKVAPASGMFGRIRGLVGRLRLRQGEGLWLTPAQGAHTVGLLFPIDVVFLDEANRVIHLIEHLGPFCVTPFLRKCASVLELPAHTIYASRIHLGDELVICPPHELGMFCTASADARQDGAKQEGVVQ